ncbi:MAG: glycoside hydrolase family 3 C-terminal domain-containing protein, partial [Clostridia bacterium]|nr:glycoside hydrolase family 3 C-terminal domain-containing protein [Clostridia bacterium]
CGTFARPCMFNFNNVEMLVGGGSGRVVRLTRSFDMIELLKNELGGEILFEPAFTEDTPWITDLVGENAKNSDISLVFAGTGSRVETEGRDREPAMKLFSAIDRVILDVAEANPNTVVVLFAGAPIDMSAWINKVAAVVWAGFPGEKGGEAIANVLTGKVNASGKLTETFPVHYEDTPAAKGRITTTATHYEEGVFVGYRYYDTYGKDVLFPFGFGLSYSSFAYRNLQLCAKGGLNLEVEFEIENESAVDGKEVAEVYVRAIGSSVVRPNKELKAFCKTQVKAGGKATVRVSLGREAFTYWSEAEGRFAVEDCEYEIVIAASAKDERLCAKIRISGGEITVL